MPRKISGTKRNISVRKEQTGMLGKIKLAESYTSLILGAIVVLIIGIFLLSFARINRHGQTSSTMIQTPKSWSEMFQNSNTSSTYTVRPGDDLWTISVNVYNDGYRWVEIARINNLENPGIIHAGNKLIIPPAVSKTPIEISSGTSQAPNTTIQNNSITGNTYTVVKGDNLWDIAVRAYGDGFRWPDIAKANHLVNPRLIHPGNFFIIPR
jgi:nucleoid-associated protein YgaU